MQMNLHGRLWETRKEVRSSGYYDPIWVLGKEKGKMKGGREGKGRQGKRKEKKRRNKCFEYFRVGGETRINC